MNANTNTQVSDEALDAIARNEIGFDGDLQMVNADDLRRLMRAARAALAALAAAPSVQPYHPTDEEIRSVGREYARAEGHDYPGESGEAYLTGFRAGQNVPAPAAPAKAPCTCCGCGGCKVCLGIRVPCPRHSTPAVPGPAASSAVPVQQPRPMDTAPKDGTMLLLLVDPNDPDDSDSFTPFEDSTDPGWTIGFNSLEKTDEDRWQFAGWNWEQDMIIDGAGTPIGWLPFDPTGTAASPAPAPEQSHE